MGERAGLSVLLETVSRVFAVFVLHGGNSTNQERAKVLNYLYITSLCQIKKLSWGIACL